MTRNPIQPSGENHFTKFGTFAIMTLGILWIFEVAAVGPAIGVIQAAFPGSTEAEAQYVMMGVYIGLAVACPISGRLALRFDKKTLTLIGLLITGVAGIMPAFMTSIQDIIFWRIITGLGAGIVVPMMTAIIADKSSGGHRTRIMGRAYAWGNVGSVIISTLVGIGMMVTWKMPFYSFSVMFVAFAICLFGLPKCPPSLQEISDANKNKEKVPLKGFMFFYLGTIAFFYCFNSFATTNIAFLVLQDGIVNPAMIGIIIAVLACSAAVGGALFPRFVAQVKSMYTPICIIFSGCGYIILQGAYTLPQYFLGFIVVGYAMGAMVPYLTNMVAVRSSSQREKDVAMGWANLGLPVGCFVCVPYGDFVKTLNPGTVYESDIRFLWAVIAVTMIAAGVATIFTRSKKLTARMLEETQMLA